jgi:hypothetical protein
MNFDFLKLMSTKSLIRTFKRNYLSNFFVFFTYESILEAMHLFEILIDMVLD